MSEENEKRNLKVVSFKLTDDEHEAIKAFAQIEKLSASEFMRRAIFDKAKIKRAAYARRISDENSENLFKILGQLGRIASNLNQLTKLANTSKSLPEQSALLHIFREFKGLRAEIIKAHDESEQA